MVRQHNNSSSPPHCHNMFRSYDHHHVALWLTAITVSWICNHELWLLWCASCCVCIIIKQLMVRQSNNSSSPPHCHNMFRSYDHHQVAYSSILYTVYNKYRGMSGKFHTLSCSTIHNFLQFLWRQCPLSLETFFFSFAGPLNQMPLKLRYNL
jgi:hypothetical protein